MINHWLTQYASFASPNAHGFARFWRAVDIPTAPALVGYWNNKGQWAAPGIGEPRSDWPEADEISKTQNRGGRDPRAHEGTRVVTEWGKIHISRFLE